MRRTRVPESGFSASNPGSTPPGEGGHFKHGIKNAKAKRFFVSTPPGKGGHFKGGIMLCQKIVCEVSTPPGKGGHFKMRQIPGRSISP